MTMKRPEPTNVQNEPPYPRHQTVVMRLADGSMSDHPPPPLSSSNMTLSKSMLDALRLIDERGPLTYYNDEPWAHVRGRNVNVNTFNALRRRGLIWRVRFSQPAIELWDVAPAGQYALTKHRRNRPAEKT